MHPRPTLLRLTFVALACLAGAASVAAPAASAGLGTATSVRHAKTVPAAEISDRHATFRLRGLAARRIVRARVVVAGRSRDVGRARARAGARHGRLRVRLSAGPRASSRSRPVLRLIVRGPAARFSSATRLYSSSSPWNRPVARGARVDPRSSTMVRSLVRARAAKGFPLSVREWTVPTYFADARTPRHDVALRGAPPRWTDVYGTPGDFIGPPPGWITDPGPWAPRTGPANGASPTVMSDVPIPRDARPDPELDGHMTVIDRSTGCEYDFYAAHEGRRGWQALWANTIRTDGSGVYPQGLSSKASGFAGTAGLVWPEELRAGRIDHALFMSFPYTKSGGAVAPATSSDGKTTSSEAIPIGARIQLDPSLNLDSLGLAPYERTVARALQEYGMIVGDTGGAMGLFAVHPQSYATNPYAGLLPGGPYAYLDRIPVDRFRVLEVPPQRTNLLLRLHETGCGRLN